jgi:hypothetical protein
MTKPVLDTDRLEAALVRLHAMWMDAERAAYKEGLEGSYEAGLSKGIETSVEILMAAINTEDHP